MLRAPRFCMVAARTFEELDAWQLSSELRDTIFTLTETGPVLKNLKFRDQIRESSSSPPANLSEGFGRFRPREFAHYARIARASLLETRNHLLDGRTKKYLSDDSNNQTAQIPRVLQRQAAHRLDVLNRLNLLNPLEPS